MKQIGHYAPMTIAINLPLLDSEGLDTTLRLVAASRMGRQEHVPIVMHTPSRTLKLWLFVITTGTDYVHCKRCYGTERHRIRDVISMLHILGYLTDAVK